MHPCADDVCIDGAGTVAWRTVNEDMVKPVQPVDVLAPYREIEESVEQPKALKIEIVKDQFVWKCILVF